MRQTYRYDAGKLAEFNQQPVVISGRIVTHAGVSAGIDFALTLAANIAGPEVAQGIQLTLEYDPKLPFNAGDRSKEPKTICDMAAAGLGDR